MRDDAVERLVAKLRAFVRDGLDPDEREVLALLLAPGVAESLAGADVEGFDAVAFVPGDLPSSLRRALTRWGLKVEGLER